ncbi:unnamed protein product [Moneuplotes crassus]|uniref:Uncharacterized protein n=1 Tax=Euplotes crassus TaxID=5936 RepID=A0AAD2D325_EUPCR|nr:unnamed protein product [Moneuplotes crassus]
MERSKNAMTNPTLSQSQALEISQITTKEKAIMNKETYVHKKIIFSIIGEFNGVLLLWGNFLRSNSEFRHLANLKICIPEDTDLSIDPGDADHFRSFDKFLKTLQLRDCKELLLYKLNFLNKSPVGLGSYIRYLSKPLSFVTKEFQLVSTNLGPKDISKILLCCRHLEEVVLSQCVIAFQTKKIPKVSHIKLKKIILSCCQLKEPSFLDLSSTIYEHILKLVLESCFKASLESFQYYEYSSDYLDPKQITEKFQLNPTQISLEDNTLTIDFST